jgi:hypothetical protein
LLPLERLSIVLLSIDNSIASRDIADTLYNVNNEHVLRKFSTANDKHALRKFSTATAKTSSSYLAEFGFERRSHYSR